MSGDLFHMMGFIVGFNMRCEVSLLCPLDLGDLRICRSVSVCEPAIFEEMHSNLQRLASNHDSDLAYLFIKYSSENCSDSTTGHCCTHENVIEKLWI